MLITTIQLTRPSPRTTLVSSTGAGAVYRIVTSRFPSQGAEILSTALGMDCAVAWASPRVGFRSATLWRANSRVHSTRSFSAPRVLNAVSPTSRTRRLERYSSSTEMGSAYRNSPIRDILGRRLPERSAVAASTRWAITASFRVARLRTARAELTRNVAMRWERRHRRWGGIAIPARRRLMQLAADPEA